MKKGMLKFSFKKAALSSFGLVFASSVALAQDASAHAQDGSMAKAVTALACAIVMGLAAFAAASGQGKAASSAVEGIARNPTSRGDVFTPLILSLVFMEFQALLGFIVAMLLFGKI